jgi:hypothetical protein
MPRTYTEKIRHPGCFSCNLSVRDVHELLSTYKHNRKHVGEEAGLLLIRHSLYIRAEAKKINKLSDANVGSSELPDAYREDLVQVCCFLCIIFGQSSLIKKKRTFSSYRFIRDKRNTEGIGYKSYMTNGLLTYG